MKEIILQTTWQEWLGVVFSIFQVVLARYNNPKNYLFGIAGILLTLVVMFNSKLYAEFTLNIYYYVLILKKNYKWILVILPKKDFLLHMNVLKKFVFVYQR